jgi:heme-degrading monooxygenase HmoA
MYARTTLLEIDTLRFPLEEALHRFEDAVMPRLREQPGFCGIYVLTTPEGRAMLVTFWETADQADAAAETGWYPEVLAEHTTLFRAPPGRERYEVRIAVPPGAPIPPATTNGPAR